MLAPVFIEPVKKKLVVALCQSLMDLDAELRTTLLSAPLFENFKSMPSFLPISLFPPKVSLLEPKA